MDDKTSKTRIRFEPEPGYTHLVLTLKRGERIELDGPGIIVFTELSGSRTRITLKLRPGVRATRYLADGSQYVPKSQKPA